MEEVTRSNMKPLLSSGSKCVSKEQALAAWRFQPSNTAKDQDNDSAWFFQTSEREMEIVTRALERELNSRPEDGIIIRTSNDTIAGTSITEVASSSMSTFDPGSPSRVAVEAKASLEVSDSKAGQFEAPGIRTPPVEALTISWNNQRSIPAMNNLIGKKRSRRENRAPITIIRADPADFQAMVQQMTGFPLEKSRSAPSLLKPQPKRPGRISSKMIPTALPTLDSSSLVLPVAINSLFGAHPNYLHPAAVCNNLAENSVYSVSTATSSSHINSIGIDKANTLESQINAFSQRDFWN